MKIVAPKNCPSCGSLLERVKDQLFCRNSADCPAQSVKRLQNFCKKLKIKGFGEKTLHKLELTSILDILDLTPKMIELAGFSAHMAEKLSSAIADRITEGITKNDFLAACSIELIGDGAMRKLRFDNITNITYDLCKTHGIGDKAANSLLDWISENEELISRWEPLLNTIKSQTVTQPTEIKGVVCITGKLNDFKNRSDAANFLTSQGFEVKSSVTKAVTHLICEDGTTGSSYQKAIKNNIKITTIKDLLEDK
jgi:DNA ligase (NAD+)